MSSDDLPHQATEIERGPVHGWEIALTFHRLGEIAEDRSDLAEARARYCECLTIARELGDRHRVAAALGGFAALAIAAELLAAVPSADPTLASDLSTGPASSGTRRG